MKKIVLVAILSAFLVGCTSRTEYGDCIGVADEKDPALIYKLSVWNTVLAVFFVELIVPPIAVLVNQTFCPVGRKDKHE